jgi:hypothetical protein
MKSAKKKKLETKGWKVGTVGPTFLWMTAVNSVRAVAQIIVV